MILNFATLFLITAASARNCTASADPKPADPNPGQPDPAFGPSRINGDITWFEANSFSQMHCVANVEARKAFDKTLPGGPDHPLAKIALATNKWVAMNDVNLGGFEVCTNCGKCVQVTASFKKLDLPLIKTTIGPLLVADRCGECPDLAIDLRPPAFKDLGIPRQAIQPGQDDGGSAKMETSWHFVSCDGEYKVTRHSQ